MPPEPSPPPSSPDHYFTAEPASAEQLGSATVRLAGRDVVVRTAAGVFSPGRVDQGTSVLLRTVPPPDATGNLVDLGCGWGPLALTMAMQSPGRPVWAVDVNLRALDLLRRTAQDLGLPAVLPVTPDQVPADLEVQTLWSNPPIRVGKVALHAMLATWLGRLTPTGSAWLVVGRHLGADPLQRWIADELGLTCERAASAKGFRVLRVTRGASGRS